MQSLRANEAKTRFGTMLVDVQAEPIEIIKNGSSVAVVMSKKEYAKIEELKMELVRSRFENIDAGDLVGGDEFFCDLESGKYD